MKITLIIASLCLLLSGCSTSAGVAPKGQNSSAVQAANLNLYLTGEEGIAALSALSAQVDITALSDVMAFAQINAMMYDVETYLGQTVKMQGIYDCYHMTTENESYHYLMLLDETACCQGTLDFRLPEGSDYPPPGAEIMVYGEFALYEFSFGTYPVIAVDSYVVVDPAPVLPTITVDPSVVGPVAVGPLA